MISEIKIHNFQSHPDTHIRLDPGVNVFIGSSDHGKSAVLRAVKWVIDNSIKGKGDSSKTTKGIPYASKWVKTPAGTIKKGKECSVTLCTDKGEVRRFRDSERNGYAFNGKSLEAIGTDVPDEVSDFLNIDTVNIQRQADPPFLISWTSGDVSRFFNKVVKLEAIDQAIHIIDSKKRATSSDIKVTKVAIEQKIASIKEYDWVDKADKLVSDLENLDKKRIRISAEYDTLFGMLEKVYEYQEEIDDTEKILKAESSISAAVSIYNKWKSTGTDANRLKEMYLFAEKCQKTLDRTKGIVKAEKLINECVALKNSISKSQEDARKLYGILDNYKYHEGILKKVEKLTSESLITKLKYLQNLSEKIKSEKSVVSNLEKTYNRVEGLRAVIKEKASLIRKLEEKLPDVCPYCNGTGKCK